jgi:hypothetical protein
MSCNPKPCCPEKVAIYTRNDLLMKYSGLDLNTFATQTLSGLPSEWIPHQIVLVNPTSWPVSQNAIGAFYSDPICTIDITDPTDDFSSLTAQDTFHDCVFSNNNSKQGNTIFFKMSSLNGAPCKVDVYVYGRDLADAKVAESVDNCLSPCKVISIPGPRGYKGDNGANGLDGKNAFTQTTAPFIVPNVNSTVTINVLDTTWMSSTGIDGQVIHIASAGYYEVINTISPTIALVKNLGYSVNAIPGVSIAAGVDVSPGGLKGLDGALSPPVQISQGGTGQITAQAAFDALSPLTLPGQILFRNATNNVPLAPSTPNTVLHSGTNPFWGPVNMATDVSGILGIGQGGTGATTAPAARAALGAAASGVNTDITQITGLTTPLSVTQGGTGANNAPAARANLSAAASGANSDITSLTALSVMPTPATATALAVPLNWGLVAANSEASVTVAVTGAALNNLAEVAWSAALPAGILVKQVFVSAANQVTIIISNVTGAAINVSTIANVHVLKF